MRTERIKKEIAAIEARLEQAEKDGDVNRIGGAQLDLLLARERLAYYGARERKAA